MGLAAFWAYFFHKTHPVTLKLSEFFASRVKSVAAIVGRWIAVAHGGPAHPLSVTRLVELSPTGRLLSLGIFLKITELAHMHLF
jgi:hypothetical protein